MIYSLHCTNTFETNTFSFILTYCSRSEVQQKEQTKWYTVYKVQIYSNSLITNQNQTNHLFLNVLFDLHSYFSSHMCKMKMLSYI